MEKAADSNGNEPYCGNCGYVLRGATESSKCPECGKPLVDVLMRPGFDRKRSIRYRSAATFLGVPVIAIAAGKYGPERVGRATGIIAIGDIATGVIAVGLFARGILTFGVFSLGIVSFGSLSVGLCALGAVSVGALAMGGIAVGGVALGGLAIGVLRAVGGTRILLPL
jgi:predicted RNA-binding Zn-ribbon protein involved in translation (DUF1610 family)